MARQLHEDKPSGPPFQALLEVLDPSLSSKVYDGPFDCPPGGYGKLYAKYPFITGSLSALKSTS